MLRNSLRIGAALTVFATAVGLVAAQVVQTQVTASTSPPLRAKQVIGAQVSLQGGSGVGTVEDLVLNSDGVIDYLIVSEAGKLVTVPWDAAKFNVANRTAVINVTPARFRLIPSYTVTTYPDFYAPTYRVQVNRHFGLTPGQERRLERRELRRP